MDKRRLGIALLAALIISVGITSLFYVRISRQASAGRPKVKHVIAAAVALQPGTPITPDNLTDIEWPESSTVEGLIARKEDAVGLVLMQPVNVKEPIFKRDLASSGSFGLAAKIPDGMRALAVQTNEVNNLAGFIFPGCRVDLLLTMRDQNNSNPTTRTVLQNVEVLSTGAKIAPDPSGKPENVGTITLLVTPQDSEKVVLAQSQGSIHFVLRNGGDGSQVNPPAIDVSDLTGVSKKVVEPELGRPRRSAAAKKPTVLVYSVETISGDKLSIAKFPN